MCQIHFIYSGYLVIGLVGGTNICIFLSTLCITSKKCFDAVFKVECLPPKAMNITQGKTRQFGAEGQHDKRQGGRQSMLYPGNDVHFCTAR